MQRLIIILILSVIYTQTALAFQTDPIISLIKNNDLRTKDWKIEINTIDKESLAPYTFISFSITDEINYDHIAYGTGLAIISSNEDNSYRLIWETDFINQYSPHSIYFIDFNKDGNKEILTYSGYEETSITRVYFNNLDTEEPNFSLVYENLLAYTSIVDFDHDGILEIIDPLKIIVPPYIGYEPDYQFDLNDDTKRKVIKEFDRIKIDLDKYEYPNSDSTESYYKIWALQLDAKTRIINLYGNSIIDVSKRYPKHFCFRKNIINEYQNVGKYIQEDIKDLKKFYESNYCPD